MKVFYRNHIELMRKRQIKKDSLLIEKMLSRKEGEKNGFLE